MINNVLYSVLTIPRCRLKHRGGKQDRYDASLGSAMSLGCLRVLRKRVSPVIWNRCVTTTATYLLNLTVNLVRRETEIATHTEI